jgi:hypothetical protein
MKEEGEGEKRKQTYREDIVTSTAKGVQYKKEKR